MSRTSKLRSTVPSTVKHNSIIEFGPEQYNDAAVSSRPETQSSKAHRFGLFGRIGIGIGAVFVMPLVAEGVQIAAHEAGMAITVPGAEGEAFAAQGNCPPGYNQVGITPAGNPICDEISPATLPGQGTPTTVHTTTSTTVHTGSGSNGTPTPPAVTPRIIVTTKLVDPDGDGVGSIETITSRGGVVISDIIDCGSIPRANCDFNEKSRGTADGPSALALLLSERGIDPTTLNQDLQDILTSIGRSVSNADQLNALTQVWAYIGKGELPGLVATTIAEPATTIAEPATTIAEPATTIAPVTSSESASTQSTLAAVSAVSQSTITSNPTSSVESSLSTIVTAVGSSSQIIDTGKSTNPNRSIDYAPWLLAATTLSAAGIGGGILFYEKQSKRKAMALSTKISSGATAAPLAKLSDVGTAPKKGPHVVSATNQRRASK
jgi:hypothetical protein